jgi:hypothetical protein
MGFRKPLTRRSRTGGYTGGYWVDDAPPVDTTIEGSVQPAPGRVRDNIPEGYDSTSAQLLITDALLVTAEAGGNQRPDQIEYNSEFYVVLRRERWQNDVLNHYEYTIALPDNAAART